MFINRELYFANPASLNDPYDCQLSIVESINYAVKNAKSDTSKPLSTEKLYLLDTLYSCSTKMEDEIRNAGVFSLSKTCKNVLMWSHYADEHKGLCIGYKLPEDMSDFDSQDLMLSHCPCNYTHQNPIAAYLRCIDISTPLLEWDGFWQIVLSIGLISKHKSWQYEKEVRILRKRSGTIMFNPKHISEIVFGLKTNYGDRKTIVKLLEGPEWSHVKYYRMIKSNVGFDLKKVEDR